MRNSPRHTLVAVVRDAVEAWRKRAGLSQAAVVQLIVEAHEQHGLDVSTELHFDSDRDAYRRMITNAERVYRWLDDFTKKNNQLPANFVPSILAALPMDLRIHVVDTVLMPAGLSVRELAGGDQGKSIVSNLQVMAKEAGEATAAVAALCDGATPAELMTAQKELTESLAAHETALKRVEGMLSSTVKH